MADVKICDRCGKTIVATKLQSFGFGSWRYSVWDCNVEQQTCYRHDLCVGCGEKLTRFLNGEELVKDAQSDEKPDDALIVAR
jgi:hypothetical protein